MKAIVLIYPLFLLLCLTASASSNDVKISEIKREGLAQKSAKGDCTLIHIWATWCSICLDDLPKLVRWLETQKTIQPVVVDTSSIYVYKNFSQKWLTEVVKPNFEVFRKPADEKAHEFTNALDKEWEGGLPLNLLYHKGKLVKRWESTVDFKELEKLANATCKQ